MPNPIEKLKDAALESVQHPRRTAEHLVGKAVGVARELVHAGQAATDLIASRITGGRGDIDGVPEPPEPDLESATDDHGEHAAPVMRVAAKKAPPPSKKPAKKAAAKKTGAKKTAKKATKKSPATKAATKAPSKKAPAKKAPAKRTAPPSAAATASDAGIGEGPDVETPVGTTGAGEATNPDTAETDLQQPGTEPLVDPSTAKAVASEAETMGRAADPEKG